MAAAARHMGIPLVVWKVLLRRQRGHFPAASV
jgi:hypothetical protein